MLHQKMSFNSVLSYFKTPLAVGFFPPKQLFIGPVDCRCVEFKLAYMDCCCSRSAAAAAALQLHQRTSWCCSSGLTFSRLLGRVLIMSCCCWRKRRSSADRLLLSVLEELEEGKDTENESLKKFGPVSGT